MKFGWEVVHVPDFWDLYITHINPIEDAKEHMLGKATQCWCKPVVERSNDYQTMIIHNAKDGREFLEDERGSRLGDSGD